MHVYIHIYIYVYVHVSLKTLGSSLGRADGGQASHTAAEHEGLCRGILAWELRIQARGNGLVFMLSSGAPCSGDVAPLQARRSDLMAGIWGPCESYLQAI